MAELQKIIQQGATEKLERPPWADTAAPPPPNARNITQRAIDLYLMSKQPNGDMGGIGWWQAANGYTAIALHDRWAGSQQNYDVVATALRQCEGRHAGLINEFNDDSLWWALCCLHVFSLGGDAWFLDQAKGVWAHVRSKDCVCGRGQIRFHDQDMEGACFWTTRPGEGQINSISTGLFAELSVRLALLDGGRAEKHPHLSKLMGRKPVGAEEYVETARCSLGWILRCRYRPRDGVVLDGIRLKKQEAVDWTFTYNTGVAIGVCALLYEATRQEEYMLLACHMAQKAVRNRGWVEANGVLTEHGAYGKGSHNPVENNDAVGFKAVLMRHLGTLYDVIARTDPPNPEARETAGLIRAFVGVNFQSQQERNTNGNGQYGPWWNGPFETPTSHSQMAVLDVMAAVMAVDR